MICSQARILRAVLKFLSSDKFAIRPTAGLRSGKKEAVFRLLLFLYSLTLEGASNEIP